MRVGRRHVVFESDGRTRVARDPDMFGVSGGDSERVVPARCYLRPTRPVGGVMNHSDLVLEFIDWSSVGVLRGSGMDLKRALGDFLAAESSDRASDLWWGLEEVAFAQNTLYGAAESVVEVMLAALVDGPPAYLQAWILEVLRFILTGASEDDPELAGRCREAAKRGVWLLVAEMQRSEAEENREAVLEVLDLLDPAISAIVRQGRSGRS